MSVMASQITGASIVCTTVCSSADKEKNIKSLRHWPVNSPHKGPQSRKMFPFDDVIMKLMLMRRTVWYITLDRHFNKLQLNGQLPSNILSLLVTFWERGMPIPLYMIFCLLIHNDPDDTYVYIEVLWLVVFVVAVLFQRNWGNHAVILMPVL